MAFAVGAAGGEKFVEADVDHDAGDAAEEDAHDVGGYDTAFTADEVA